MHEGREATMSIRLDMMAIIVMAIIVRVSRQSEPNPTKLPEPAQPAEAESKKFRTLIQKIRQRLVVSFCF